MALIVIEGAPVPWMAHAGFGRRSFNPRFREKDYAVHYIKLQYGKDPFTGPVSVGYDFQMSISKSVSKKKHSQMVNNILEHTTRPDCTNLIKFIEDCLKGIVFVDDSQVTEIIARKRYSEHPRTVITIKPLTEELYDGKRTSL